MSLVALAISVDRDVLWGWMDGEMMLL